MRAPCPKCRAAQQPSEEGESNHGEIITEKTASELQVPETGHSKNLCVTELLTYMTYNCLCLLWVFYSVLIMYRAVC